MFNGHTAAKTIWPLESRPSRKMIFALPVNNRDHQKSRRFFAKHTLISACRLAAPYLPMTDNTNI
jgi:hypothetical protein